MVALIAATVPARPASFSYSDPQGDSLVPLGSMDVLRVSYDIRAVDASGARHFVVEMELAAPPEKGFAGYHTYSTPEDCAFLKTYYRPASLMLTYLNRSFAGIYLDCGGTDFGQSIDVPVRIEGSKIIWATPMASLPPKLRRGVLSDLSALAQPTDPTGYYGPGDIDVARLPAPADSISTDQTWKYS